jgi:hypothetical protein
MTLKIKETDMKIPQGQNTAPTGWVPGKVNQEINMVPTGWVPREVDWVDVVEVGEQNKILVKSLTKENSLYNTHEKVDIKKPHSHYFKDVSHLQTIDVYRVLELFNVTDPCLQHALKKLLVAGGRGAGKDIIKDVSEVIDSCNRFLVMKKENETKE